MKIKVDPELLKISKARSCTVEGKQVHDFFLALAACNTIVPLAVDTSDPAVKLVDYQGESPDEQALVYAAAAYGFMLVERTSGHIVINVQGEMQRQVEVSISYVLNFWLLFIFTYLNCLSLCSSICCN